MPNNHQYSDIDLNFIPHPSTGDLVAKYDDNAIKNAVKNLILTKHYERPFHSEIGSNVNKLLFEIPSPGIVSLLRAEIQDVIRNFEPRAEILDIQITFAPDYNTIFITIIFRIINSEKPITVQFTLNRTR